MTELTARHVCLACSQVQTGRSVLHVSKVGTPLVRLVEYVICVKQGKPVQRTDRRALNVLRAPEGLDRRASHVMQGTFQTREVRFSAGSARPEKLAAKTASPVLHVLRVRQDCWVKPVVLCVQLDPSRTRMDGVSRVLKMATFRWVALDQRVHHAKMANSHYTIEPGAQIVLVVRREPTVSVLCANLADTLRQAR